MSNQSKRKRSVVISLLILGFLCLLTACGQGGNTENSRTGRNAEIREAEDGSEKEEDSVETEASGGQTASALREGQGVEGEKPEAAGDSHVLIVWFSMPENVDTSGVDAIGGASIVVKNDEVMGNTEYAAKVVQEVTGADMFRIETVQSYPLEHDTLVDQAAQEQDDNLRPELASNLENLEQYDTIILGYPNWWGDLPMPVYSFLEGYDLSGKTIIPFVTHGGSSFSNTRSTIARLQPSAVVSDNTLSLSRNSVAASEAEIRQWAESLGVN